MKNSISLFLLLPLLFAGQLLAQSKKKKSSKAHAAIVKQLKADITYLASDALEGRRTGSIGEKLAANYISTRMSKVGLVPFFGENFLEKFTVEEGKQLSELNYVEINEQSLSAADFAPLPFSRNGSISENILVAASQSNIVKLVPISAVTTKKLNNPHDDALVEFSKYTEALIKDGATGIIYYNDLSTEHDYTFLQTQKVEKTFDKVVLVINHDAYQKYIKPNLSYAWIDMSMQVEILPKFRTGYNVAGFIDNNAKETIIVGAHYDHLGYGEDHNSLHPDSIPAIHNGADDNASGVGAILALAKTIRKSNLQNYNYVFIAFSGEELGLYGSKKFVEYHPELMNKTNYMLNIDMLGRYDDTKKALTIGGVGTSPTWIPLIEKTEKFFTPKWDSAGIGPSDHTSFYMKNIPVLFFFTGLHTDYHKPSDDAEKINFDGEAKLIHFIYSIVEQLDNQPKLTFTKTREPKQEGARFKVTLGIMPDYTYSGNGVKADGITEGKIASRIGMQAGDIIIQLGDTKVLDMQSYMEALSKFKENDQTEVIVDRNGEKKKFPVKFSK